MEKPGTPRSGVSWIGVFAGVFIALVVPVASLAVACLWDRGILVLEPNGSFVQTLQGLGTLAIILGPIGILVAGVSTRLRGFLAWAVLVIVALPAFLLVWFVSVAYLGGLAGEPF